MNTLLFDGWRTEAVPLCFKNRPHAVYLVSSLKANPGAFSGSVVLFLEVWSLDPLHQNHVLITNADSWPKHLAKPTDSGSLGG